MDNLDNATLLVPKEDDEGSTEPGKFFSRKLAVFLIGFISGLVLIGLNKLDSSASAFICTMTGIYLAGNVVNGFKDVLKK